MTGRETKQETLQKYEDNMVACLDQIENVWLANTPYLCGDKISVADIFAACEIEQPRNKKKNEFFRFYLKFLGVAGYDPFNGRPVLNAWIDRVKTATNPFYEEAHVVLNKLAAKGGKAKL